LREGFEFQIPDDLATAAKVKNRVAELQLVELIKQASVWGRVFGDACLWLGVDDNQTVDQPLDYAKVRGIKFLSVYDRRDFTIESYYNNPLEQKFNTPEYYTMQRVNPIRGVLDPSVSAKHTSGVRIHESRLVWFKGAPTSRQKRSENAGWHHSILQKPYEVIRDFEMTWAGAAHLMTEASQGVYKVRGLMEILSSEQGAEGLQRRFQAIDEGRSVARSIVCDAQDEDYTRVNTTFTGIPDMLDRFAGRLAAAAKIPVTRLMGEAPAGLNATGEGDTRSFYDAVAAWRKAEIVPGLERIMKCVLAEARGGLGEADPEAMDDNEGEPEWTIHWPSLYQPTDKETADTRKVVADTDIAYINAGVLDPTEVTLSRFGEGGWSMDTTVDLELREKMADALTEDDIKPPAPDPGAGPVAGEGGNVGKNPKGAKGTKPPSARAVPAKPGGKAAT
jgi:phage-related protein (TIGR01555 family)